ncbi:hypothetical protein B6A27_10730 [Anoxybacillus sp. UARK-01]|uniref:hypothetical protein n=1 Tax=Anoxybacillus sp. UARK-01 TaxID=1895648 RepID=UPI0009B9C36D|nr:hypothetical protein [Anoxybacillus sp. UARK-01]OQM45659.1 hypothetical protein B6A27_10730 [Anoxybacillus sp. UARK-01]
MKAMRLFFCLLLIFILNYVPNHVLAYSYGDPNQEKIAEAYKQMAEKLNQEPPNFSEAKTIFETVKEEIEMHMGEEPVETVLADIKKKDKEATIKDMKKVLVLNIARRLENIEENFDQYETSKRLLAKAFATYEALSPAVQSQDAELDQRLRDEFNKALQSLGNPGLFGVGQKQSNVEQFKKSEQTILSSLQKQFALKSLKVGHFSENATEKKETASSQNEWTDLSKVKNWLPLLVLVAAIVAVVIYAVRRKRN